MVGKMQEIQISKNDFLQKFIGFFNFKVRNEQARAKLKENKYTKYLNYVFLFYAFCVPIARSGISLCLFLIIILWLLEGNLKVKFSLLLSKKVLVYAILLTLYLLISVLWADKTSDKFFDFRRLYYHLTIFALYTSLQKKYIKYLIPIFIFSMLISEVLSYGIFFRLWTLHHGTPSDPTPFMNHLVYSVFLAVTASLLLSQMVLSKNLKLKIFYFLFFLTASTNLFLTGGRTGQVAYIVSIFMLLMFHIKNKLKAILVIFVLLGCMLFVQYQISNTFRTRVAEARSNLSEALYHQDYSSSWGLRLSAWIVTGKILEKNPIFGTSISDIRQDYKHIVLKDKILKNGQFNAIMGNGFHDEYLEVLAGGGLIAGILFMLIFYNFCKIRIRNEEIFNAKIIILSVFIFSLTTDIFLRWQFSATLFAFFLGIFLAQERIEKSVKNKNKSSSAF